MRPGFYDPLANAEAAESNGAPSVPEFERSLVADYPQETGRRKDAPRKPMIEFLRPSAIAEYVIPKDHFLVGEGVIERGGMTVFAGAGGVGKSRAVLALAVAAARGESSWMGLPIRFPFRTMIIQSENGLPRLSKDFQMLGNAAGLDEKLLVSVPPDMLIEMRDPAFRAELVDAAQEFKPDLVVFDPLNAMVMDSQERDIKEVFGYLKRFVADVESNPALLVVHHMRKPREGDRHRGRGMANLLAGSYLITSSARAVLTLQAATDAEDDPHTVLTLSKSNNCPLVPRTAWRRVDGGFFVPATDFDWDAFDGQSGPVAKVREDHILRLFDYGKRALTLAAGAKALEEMADCKRSAAYGALDYQKGRFASLIEPDLMAGTLRLSAEGLARAAAGDED
jgi:hypothetical protein